MDVFLTSDGLFALLTLTLMEIVLGVDNIVFIAIVVAKLPQSQQAKVRSLGISLALILRLGLLFSISWLMGLTEPLIQISKFSFSGRDLILIVGGLFLLAKATKEIHDKVEGIESGTTEVKSTTFGSALIQILLLDMVFSLDSVITAVGMARAIPIMVAAMVLAVGFMLLSAAAVSEFVTKNPTVKILALSFLLLIGFVLLIEGMGGHVGKGYIYFAMAFSLGVEILNMRFRKKVEKRELH